MASAVCSAPCPSQALIPQLLPNCRAHGVGLPSIWIWCSPPLPLPQALERSEVTGAESQRLHSAMVSGGQVLVAEESSPPPPLRCLPPSRLSVYSLFTGQYLKYSKYGRHSPRLNARPIVQKEN